MWSMNLVPRDPRELHQFTADLVQEQGEVRVEVYKTRARSSPQNRFYWGVVVRHFAEFLRKQGQPWTKQRCHEVMACKFLRVTECNIVTGEFLSERIRSTTELSIEEMSEYIENCMAWLSEQFGIEFPSLDDFSTNAA